MTTATRPTFDPARGGQGRGETDLSAISKQYSSRDLPGHNKIKYRQPGQDTEQEISGRDFRKDLQDRERLAAREAAQEREKRGQRSLPALQEAHAHTTRGSRPSSSKRPKLERATAASLDADDPIDEDDSEDSSDDDDDTAALTAELNKIRHERAAELLRKEAERNAEADRVRFEVILTGNPLMKPLNKIPGQDDFSVKKRWDADVPFKNCARNEPDKGKKFINDSLRSEFHKKFMERYIQ